MTQTEFGGSRQVRFEPQPHAVGGWAAANGRLKFPARAAGARQVRFGRRRIHMAAADVLTPSSALHTIEPLRAMRYILLVRPPQRLQLVLQSWLCLTFGSR